MLAGRLLGPEKYGEFTALIALLMILSVASVAIMTVTVKYSSELVAKGYFVALSRLYKQFSRYTATFAIVLIVISFIFVKPISVFFSINDLLPICITILNFFFVFLIVVNRGVLQGGQKFFDVTTSTALEMFLKLFLGIILIKIGFGVAGAMLGMVLALVIVYFLSFLPLNKLLRTKDENKSESFIFDKKEISAFAVPVLISTTLLMVALNLDIVLVKHYFNAETAGLYAAISNTAKIILYSTSPIVTVMFAMVTAKKITGEKHYKIFFYSVMLTIIGALIILSIYVAFPSMVIKILYGQKFVSLYPLLSKVGLFILLYSLVNIMANYYLAIKNYIFLYFFGLTLLVQIVLIGLNHSNLDVMIKILISTTGLLLVLLFVYYMITKKAQLATLFKR
jgi:O-antigen/teichoic acid export membrane protein